MLIQLRWIAVLGQVVTIAIVHFGLRIPLPLAPMGMVLGALLALNALSHVWLRQHLQISSQALFSALLLDVAALTVQLYFSGGATNPFTALYLLQIALAAVLLPGRGAWLIVVVTCIAFVGLIGINQPLAVQPPTSLLRLHILGMFVCFVLGAVLLVVFISRMSRNLQERDTYLVELKRRAAEEDHIVRLGLLASGAAHELGTPLAVGVRDPGRLAAHARDFAAPRHAAGTAGDAGRDPPVQEHSQRHLDVGGRGSRRGAGGDVASSLFRRDCPRLVRWPAETERSSIMRAAARWART